ncbi:hypothetical protein BU24DRAFT_180389 [Aaosphaeria arxii CBS 175.79]|uniref:Uncharacterized protein n=1 Tax=Aaosphaeria arxii CBS 175.79 TaxID=1450172 RepID=A0A6A5XRT1_9PLEO|nr:uncharacterized protein BU24DRAFT_180389 [Aaosphaeria arxii CBS 175.79]KAF2015547.1 hypothetical protein BU24DRAFT_180389 [Aaosphaeria arxii CBS 175.79]
MACHADNRAGGLSLLAGRRLRCRGCARCMLAQMTEGVLRNKHITSLQDRYLGEIGGSKPHRVKSTQFRSSQVEERLDACEYLSHQPGEEGRQIFEGKFRGKKRKKKRKRKKAPMMIWRRCWMNDQIEFLRQTFYWDSGEFWRQKGNWASCEISRLSIDQHREQAVGSRVPTQGTVGRYCPLHGASAVREGGTVCTHPPPFHP